MRTRGSGDGRLVFRNGERETRYAWQERKEKEIMPDF